jgi:outer membrane protein assembly factor BamB
MGRVAGRAVIAMLVAGALAGAHPAAGLAAGQDWTRYGYDAARSNDGPAQTGLSTASLGHLQRQQVALPGTADSSPVYVHAARVGGGRHDLFIVTTTYGRTVAIDAASGRLRWTFTPPGYARWAGTSQITTATPVVDPAAALVYAASPDGKVHALRLASGREAKGWPVAVTRDATHEKIASALNLSRGRLLVTTGGYIGDAPPYQGHVVSITVRSGRIAHVWNSLCSDRRALLVPRTCAASDSAIWGRGGAVVEPASGRILVATGNAPWDGRTNWGDSVLELAPDASRLTQSYTPASQQRLNDQDGDLGSSSPALLPGGLVLEGGKDGTFRLLSLAHLNGRDARLGRLGGELQDVRTPGGSVVLTAPAVWTSGGRTFVAVANDAGTALYVVHGRKLAVVWASSRAGSSPIEAGGLLYVYDPSGAGLRIYRPGSPRPLQTLAAGSGHWNTPIVVDGRIALPEGNANDHLTRGVLDIWRP